MTFELQVLTASSPFYVGPCESLVVPTTDGDYGVLAGHSNVICALIPGTMHFFTPDKTLHVAAIAAGIMKVEGGRVMILVDSAIRPEDIDEERNRRQKDAAREEMLQKKSIEEYHAAQARLARALARLNVKQKYGK